MSIFDNPVATPLRAWTKVGANEGFSPEGFATKAVLFLLL